MGDDSESTWKWLAMGLGAVVSCGGICMCAGLFGLGGMLASAPQFDASIEVAQREGEEAGRVGTTDACLRTGYERAVPCGWGMDCGVMVDEYLRACLRSVPSPDPSLCVGAPSPSLTGDPLFDEAVCGSRGWPVESIACTTIVQSVEAYCAGAAAF